MVLRDPARLTQDIRGHSLPIGIFTCFQAVRDQGRQAIPLHSLFRADPAAGRRELHFALHAFEIKKSREIVDLIAPLDIRGVGEHFAKGAGHFGRGGPLLPEAPDVDQVHTYEHQANFELFHFGSFMAGVLWPGLYGHRRPNGI